MWCEGRYDVAEDLHVDAAGIHVPQPCVGEVGEFPSGEVDSSLSAELDPDGVEEALRDEVLLERDGSHDAWS
jgi:hypothetical protein